MSNIIEIKTTDNSNEWIEESISKTIIKNYGFEHFHHIQEIGEGTFGKVYRAKWKNSEQYFALKSLKSLSAPNNATVKEIIHELELQREVDFHDNVIRFYGIAVSDNGIKKFLLYFYYYYLTSG
ncbi:hypothetical protein C1645_551685 [Glomus cerebriforme]|uniref:mitogen-activated protein kinase kinase n=1 Tax=Glomus cerebriforme TaxID=658196 RepID=A0A397S596_9GLOM|nr:hypothetical protein C1645_551685 [Glomus cerebriforme]